jgi:hypothetical protein
MTHQDAVDFTTALALGALLGMGLTLALRRIRGRRTFS